MNVIILCFLFMTVATTTFAGERQVVLANVDPEASLMEKPRAVPPVISEKYEYYEVHGGCENDLQCEMRQKGISWTDGKKYDSTTSWHVKWNYGYDRTPQACSVDSFRVFVEITFRYPSWARTDNAPRLLVDKWDTFMQHLVVHENGHRDMAVEAAADLTRTVSELPPASTCAELDRKVQALSHARMNKLNVDEKEYDTATRHGYTQGAIFQ
jgi:predicted secreted Zn-dependent protease